MSLGVRMGVGHDRTTEAPHRAETRPRRGRARQQSCRARVQGRLRGPLDHDGVKSAGASLRDSFAALGRS